MRTVITIVLFLAVFSLVFSSFAADAPVAGVDYDIEPAKTPDCRGSAESVLDFFARNTGDGTIPADMPDRGALAAYEMMMCLVLDR